MLEIDPFQTDNHRLHRLLLGGIAPRPIALASTIDKLGNPNLSPFSFFNAFGVNPTTLIFSPSRRGRDNTTKHTFENLLEVPEVVINAVTYNIVHQVSLSSVEFQKGVNEFSKSGLTPLKSNTIKPFRVKESPLQFECKVRDIVETGGKAGSANLIVCEILFIHLSESILNDAGEIDIDKIDLVGRMGGDYYVRTSGDAKFVVPKPGSSVSIGVDQLPLSVRLSNYLTGNDLGQLGNQARIPTVNEIQAAKEELRSNQMSSDKEKLHSFAHVLISKGEVFRALTLLIADQTG